MPWVQTGEISLMKDVGQSGKGVEEGLGVLEALGNSLFCFVDPYLEFGCCVLEDPG